MKPSLKREQRLYDALKRITRFMSPVRLRRVSQKEYGLGPNEAVDMAYENILDVARNAIRGMRRPTENAVPMVSKREETL